MDAVWRSLTRSERKTVGADILPHPYGLIGVMRIRTQPAVCVYYHFIWLHGRSFDAPTFSRNTAWACGSRVINEVTF